MTHPLRADFPVPAVIRSGRLMKVRSPRSDAPSNVIEMLPGPSAVMVDHFQLMNEIWQKLYSSMYGGY